MAQALAPLSHLAHPLDAALSSRGAVRVLRVLLRHGGRLPLSRIARETRLSLPGALKLLDGLESLALVVVEGSGRTRLYAAAERNPVTAMLDTLFRAEAAHRQAALDAVRQATRGLPIAAAWLHGSAARGQDRPDSDLDLLIVTTERGAAAHERTAEVFRDRLAAAPALAGLKPSVVALSMAEAEMLASRHDPFWTTVTAAAEVIAGQSPRAFAAGHSAA